MDKHNSARPPDISHLSKSEVLALQKQWRLEKRREIEARNKKKMARQALSDHPNKRHKLNENDQVYVVPVPVSVSLPVSYQAPYQHYEYVGAPALAANTDEAARTLEAQRDWKEQKLRELAEERSKGTPSKRGRRKEMEPLMLAQTLALSNSEIAAMANSSLTQYTTLMHKEEERYAEGEQVHVEGHEVDVQQHGVQQHVVQQHEVQQHEVQQHEVQQHEVQQHEVQQHEVQQHEVQQHEAGVQQILHKDVHGEAAHEQEAQPESGDTVHDADAGEGQVAVEVVGTVEQTNANDNNEKQGEAGEFGIEAADVLIGAASSWPNLGNINHS